MSANDYMGKENVVLLVSLLVAIGFLYTLSQKQQHTGFAAYSNDDSLDEDSSAWTQNPDLDQPQLLETEDEALNAKTFPEGQASLQKLLPNENVVSCADVPQQLQILVGDRC